MDIVWEVDTADFARRRRAARACLTCAKNKKRCIHTFIRSQHAENLISTSRQTAAGNRRRAEQAPGRAQSKTRDEEHNSQAAIATLQQSKEHFNPMDGPASDGVSVPGASLLEPVPDTDVGHEHLAEPQQSYLTSVGTFRVLPKATQDILVTTYIACINGLLPILNSRKLLRQYSTGRASKFLIQAICLTACKTEQAVPYLRLSETGPLLTPIQFARQVYVGLDAAIKADLEPDRVTKIRILALMHLYNDGTYGIEDSSTHLSQAIQLAWAMKLHFLWPGRSTVDELSMLWWSLWSLDRFNACISGTPIMIRDRDIHLPRPPLESDPQLQVIAIWLRLGDLLGEVFDLYRPPVAQHLTEWGDEFISFSKLTDGLEASLFQTSHWVALELCFQVVAILSCRRNKPGSVSYTRRVTACDRIQVLMSENHHTQLPPLPVIPYAATLSLTGALSVLRDARKERTVAQQEVSARCQTLENLSTCWQNANVVAKLGRVALRSLQQPWTGMRDFTNLLTGIDADSVDAPRIAVTEAGQIDTLYGRAGATRTGNLTPRIQAENDLNPKDTITVNDIEPAVVQSEQISESVQDFNPEETTYYSPQTYLSQTTRQYVPPDFPPTAVPLGHDYPAIFGNAENVQGFNQLSFFEGFFDLGMPTSLQDVMSDGTLFLNEVFDESGSTDTYERQSQNC